MIKKLINSLFGTKPEPAVIKEQKVKKTPKELATEAGEPWVEVLGIDINKDNPGAGCFELDWNDKFVANLIRAGYQGKTDQDLVDNWFRSVCQNVVMENYEQEQADPDNRPNNRKDIGGGRVEIS
jgi:hypothetical protein